MTTPMLSTKLVQYWGFSLSDFKKKLCNRMRPQCITVIFVLFLCSLPSLLPAQNTSTPPSSKTTHPPSISQQRKTVPRKKTTPPKKNSTKNSQTQSHKKNTVVDIHKDTISPAKESSSNTNSIPQKQAENKESSSNTNSLSQKQAESVEQNTSSNILPPHASKSSNSNIALDKAKKDKKRPPSAPDSVQQDLHIRKISLTEAFPYKNPQASPLLAPLKYISLKQIGLAYQENRKEVEKQLLNKGQKPTFWRRIFYETCHLPKKASESPQMAMAIVTPIVLGIFSLFFLPAFIRVFMKSPKLQKPILLGNKTKRL